MIILMTAILGFYGSCEVRSLTHPLLAKSYLNPVPGIMKAIIELVDKTRLRKS